MGHVRHDRALVALVVGFFVLAATGLATIWLSEEQHRAARLVRHTLQVENQLSNVLSLMQDGETSQRGYLITSREEFLTPYERAIRVIEPSVAELDRMVADNPAQRARAVRLKKAIALRQTLLRQNIMRHRRGDPVASYVGALERGRSAMDDIRGIIAEMKAEETKLLNERVKASQALDLRMRIALGLAGIAAFIVGVFALIDAHRRLRSVIEAGEALEVANTQLRAEAASRQAAEAQARQIQKMQAIGQLTGGIAHDFNNMLAIVIGSLDLAKRRLKVDIGRAEACIDSALEGASRAAQLTARLLAFSRLQPLEPRVLDVNKLVGGMSEMLRRTIGDNLRVETVLAGGLWRTHADPAQLENAIINLCVNARDAMPEHGMLTIETTNAHLDDAYAATHNEVEPGQYVMISVSDTGAGMPQEVIERAFEPFYTTKGVGRGTGLGLSQVHGFVKQSRGHVKIYSEPGVGTTIKIYLPRSTSELDAGDAPLQSTGASPHGRAGEIILVVEDDERVRRVSVDALRELGYIVVQAADATQALSVLTLQPRIDLLFTDVVMPDLDGRRLADKARDTRPDLKVLYTTGYTRNAIVHNGMLDADVAFLAKPFTIEQLAVKVRQVLDD
jgi:signal transduction histidine kinase